MSIKSAMVEDLQSSGYIELSFNTYFRIVKDGSGYPYVRFAKIVRDSNTHSIYLHKFTLPADDMKKVRKALKNSESKGIYIDIKV